MVELTVFTIRAPSLEKGLPSNSFAVRTRQHQADEVNDSFIHFRVNFNLSYGLCWLIRKAGDMMMFCSSHIFEQVKLFSM